MFIEVDDKLRFYDYVRQDRGAPPDPHPECAFHAIEVSKANAPRQFVSFYVKRPMSTAAQDKLADILPEPGYHNPEIFHLDDAPSSWAGCKYHYHILFDHEPTKEDVFMVMQRLEDLGGTIHPPVVEDIKKYYGEL